MAIAVATGMPMTAVTPTAALSQSVSAPDKDLDQAENGIQGDTEPAEREPGDLAPLDAPGLAEAQGEGHR